MKEKCFALVYVSSVCKGYNESNFSSRNYLFKLFSASTIFLCCSSLDFPPSFQSRSHALSLVIVSHLCWHKKYKESVLKREQDTWRSCCMCTNEKKKRQTQAGVREAAKFAMTNGFFSPTSFYLETRLDTGALKVSGSFYSSFIMPPCENVIIFSDFFRGTVKRQRNFFSAFQNCKSS